MLSYRRGASCSCLWWPRRSLSSIRIQHLGDGDSDEDDDDTDGEDDKDDGDDEIM